VTDWVAAGGTVEALAKLVQVVAAEFVPIEPEAAPDTEAPDSDAAKAKAEAAAREQALIDELARLDRMAYDRRRDEAADSLGIRRPTLDEEVNRRRAEQQQQAGPAPLHAHWINEPWSEEVDTGALIDDLVRRIKRYVVLGDEAALATALWVLLAWVHADVVVHSPILWITSAEPDSGKTTLGHLVEFLTPRGLTTVGISEAALFRSIELWLPTVIATEADTMLKDNEPLRAVINSGWTRGAGVLRCVGDDQTPHFFPTFTPKVIDMLGRRLPPATLSRCVRVEMKRKLDNETCEDFDHIDDAGLQQLRSRALRWSIDSVDGLKGARPALDGFNNRLRQNWRTQIAIADLAGGTWGDKAREAAQRLANVARTEPASDRLRVLADIRAIMEPRKSEDEPLKPIDAIASAKLVGSLTADPDGHWAEYPKDKPLTQNQLARLLKHYARDASGVPIAPEQVQIAPNVQARGYLRAWFQDAWKRYLPSAGKPFSDPSEDN
jgi:putative DNA primase/helicase